MGKKRFEGVEARGQSIRVSFEWNGRRCRETLRIAPTMTNLRAAAGLRATILRSIELGTFTWSEYLQHFPRSRWAKRKAPQNGAELTFGALAERWYLGLEVATGTRKKYRQALDGFWLPRFRDRPITSIRRSELMEAVGGTEWPSAKHRNNTLIPGRAVFRLAFHDRLTAEDLSAAIRCRKVQKPAPDPLSDDEREKVLSYMRAHYPEQIWNYFEFAFFTGLRPEEQIALAWEDVDFNLKLVRIRRARTAGELKNTKTESIRDVECVSRAWAALMRQQPYTRFREHGHVFENPVTGAPYASERPTRKTYWIPALRACGVRHRRQYNTRHTFATWAIMNGALPIWVSRQLGHASPEMLYRVYAKWIDRADKDRERAKLELALGSQPGPNFERDSKSST